ncbi:MAG: cupin domain-containing protein [Candidatus Aminicenantales bacterium]
MIKSKSNSPRVEWAPKHFSWALCDYQKMSIKVEEIPPGGKSDVHLHQSACQFFFILEGKAEFRKEDSNYNLGQYEGIEVLSGEKHQIKNRGKNNLLFLLISYPPPK